MFQFFFKSQIIIHINQNIGEIGYFLDELYWWQGITTKAVKKLEKIGFNELKLRRIEILMNPKNIGSQKVAEKCGYLREGLLKNKLFLKYKYTDAYIYAKIK